jgi:antitoxin MazE
MIATAPTPGAVAEATMVSTTYIEKPDQLARQSSSWYQQCWYTKQVSHMRAPVRKMGNSAGIIIPKPILSQVGVEAGDDLDLSLEGRRIVLVPAKRHPRAGWAAAAKEIAEQRDDKLVWPEFGNDDDRDLKW